MTSTAGNPNSPPANPDPEAGRVQSLDARFAAQDQKIDGLGGKLDQVLTAVTGKAKPPDPSPPAGDPPAPPGGQSIADQVRAGVAEIMAQKDRDAADAQAAEARKAHDAEHQRLAAMEHRPAQPGTGRRTRLQRWLVGKPDQL